MSYRDRSFSWDLVLENGFQDPDSILFQKNKFSSECINNNSEKSRENNPDIKIKEEIHLFKETKSEILTKHDDDVDLKAALVNIQANSNDTEDNTKKIGYYTKEERQLMITKFREKKSKRCWNKQVKNYCRKRLADMRPRVKGRFIPKEVCTNDFNLDIILGKEKYYLEDLYSIASDTTTATTSE